ncbi:MAG: hypothetical protein GYB31_03540 [Bacteroidetes bacterium]|nr:hypothetical protein [Bacteroidota bacterium]
MNKAYLPQMFKTLSLAAAVFVLLINSGCGRDKGKYIPDVSHINADVEIRRFEQDLFAIDTSQFESGLEAVQAAYPEFSAVFFGQILGSTDPRIAPEGHIPYVKGFVTFEGIQKLYDTCQIVYPDLTEVEKGFEDAFRFFNYYFPEKVTPTVTTFISEYTVANFIYGENDLAVGLDFFLGEDYPYARLNPSNPNFSNYLTRSNNRAHLISKTLLPLVEDLVGPPAGNRLLDYMLNNGKKRYILEQLLPYEADTILLEYSAEELQWCRENERNTWAYLLDEEMLYSTRYQDFRKLIEYSPTGTSMMPPESPGRVGNYMGLQIIKAYLDRHPDTSLQDLILLDDSQRILDLSRYKPVR